eukprot:765022-Hanusia_phi.AAC.3
MKGRKSNTSSSPYSASTPADHMSSSTAAGLSSCSPPTATYFHIPCPPVRLVSPAVAALLDRTPDADVSPAPAAPAPPPVCGLALAASASAQVDKERRGK